MTYLNNKSNNNHPVEAAAIAATTISVLAIAIIIMLTSTTIASPVAATSTATATAGTTTTSSATPSSGIKLSPEPIYQEIVPPGSVTPINQTHIAVTHTGNGMLTLPNSNQTINVISNGSAIFSFATPSAIAKETIRAPNGETVTTTFYEIIQFSNPTEAPLGGGKGIKIIIFHTNSTGMLAPLDGVIAAAINDLQPNGESELTAWRWESGLPISAPNVTTTTTIGGAPLMNTTTTAIDAATVVETNTTSISEGEAEARAIGELSEEQQQLSVEEQQQAEEEEEEEEEQAITTAPS